MEADQSNPVSAFGAPLSPGRTWLISELSDLGFTGRGIARLVRSGVLVRIRRGYYIDRQRWIAMSKDEQELQRILAHAELSSYNNPAINVGTSAVPAGVYSHTTAARLHGLHLWDVPADVHVTFAGRRSTLTLPQDVRPHYRPLPASQVVRVQGVAASSPERTVVDCARTIEFEKSLIIADHALHLGASTDRLSAIVDQLSGAKGIRNARAVLAAADGRSESPGETRTRYLFSRSGLPMPEVQLEVTTDVGRYRLDFGWRAWRLAVEFDGDAKYFDYAPTGQVLLAERKREKALMEAGWRFIRLEWKDLARPKSVEQRVRAMLAQQAQQQ